MQSTVNGNSIQHIIELDKKARQRVAEAKSEAEKIISESERKKEELLKKYHEDSQKHLNIVEKTYRDEADKKIPLTKSLTNIARSLWTAFLKR